MRENIKILVDPRDLVCLPVYFPNTHRKIIIIGTVLEQIINVHPQLPPQNAHLRV